jgi:PAS domain S-box-containing protein
MLERLKKDELEIILNSTHDGMIAVTEDGIIALFNAAAERLIGITAKEAIGRPVVQIVPNTRLPDVLKSGQAELNRQQKLGGITIITNRVPVLNREGEIIGAAAVFRDISEIKALAEELTNLREIQTLLEAVINSTQDAISVVDEQGIGIMVNPAYTRLTGLSKEDVLNQPATVDIAEGESMHYQVLRTRQSVWGVRMKVGPQRKEVLVSVAPIIVKGELKGSVGIIHDISEIKKLTEELEQAKRLIRRLEAKYTFKEIIGESKGITAAIDQAKRAAQTPATVLLRGESGTGKELFAHAIHHASKRSRGQFVRVNCASLVDSLLESELFGYVEGAFTGAKKGGRLGLIEEANGGTIFLDEIGEISLPLQAKLLRVLQEKEIIRVGDTKTIPVDVRIIAATNAPLEKLVKKSQFREDLYYRVNVFPIYIPPLRQQKEDIPILALHLVRKFNQEYGRNVEEIVPEAIELLQAYDWPGNVRELENILGRSIINMKFNETVLQAHHLPLFSTWLSVDEKQPNQEAGARAEKYEGQSYQESFDSWERELLVKALARADGNKTKAARILKISIRSLYYKLEKYGLQET